MCERTQRNIPRVLKKGIWPQSVRPFDSGRSCVFNLWASDRFGRTFGLRADGIFTQSYLSNNIIMAVKDKKREKRKLMRWFWLIRELMVTRWGGGKESFSIGAPICLMMSVSKLLRFFSSPKHLNRTWRSNPNILIHGLRKENTQDYKWWSVSLMSYGPAWNHIETTLMDETVTQSCPRPWRERRANGIPSGGAACTLHPRKD